MFSTYDPEAWLPTLNLRMTPFIFYPWITLTAFITFLTAFVEYHREYLGEFSLSTDAHIIMGGALSFLVVFRTNSSYDRWWEARCSWQTVISTCRTLAAMVMPVMNDERSRENVGVQIMGFLLSLKAFVRDEKIRYEELGERMNRDHIDVINKSSCGPLMAITILGHTARHHLPQEKSKPVQNAHGVTESGADSMLGPALYMETTAQLRILATQVFDCREDRQRALSVRRS